ncbi:MAG: asparagine--tRNA ligase [Desulfobacterales bacterium]|nr:asparagine--tRNA ligase [Desulfobacterales bacterium]
MKRTKVLHLLSAESPIEELLVKGWVRTRRDAKGFSFIEINDGSCLANLQVVADTTTPGYDMVTKLSTGSAVTIIGELVNSAGKGQKWEVQARKIEVISVAPENYPLQKKRHSDEFLRTIAHLRPRTNKYGAAFRIRSELSWAIHKFFREKGFCYLHTPILTGSDCEGAGEMFQVTAMDLKNIPKNNGRVDFEQDFFGTPANLTVSGQLSAEMFALALGEVYTFGPTFRAENSNTRRHAAEFWMVEPEMAFYELSDNMDLAEVFIKHLVLHIIEKCSEDVALFSKFVDKTLMTTLENIIQNNFVQLPYTEAIDILLKSGKTFEYKINFGTDLQSEHEKFLTEIHFKKPVIVYNYPKTIKPFYMRVNDDNKTVAAMDVLVPGIGEIIGGSQREERLDFLESRMEELGMEKAPYWWYLDSRRFGSAPHSGFGLGFERLLMLVTGISNIRDVIPFPRTPNSIEF